VSEPFTTDVAVRYSDVDTYGHVNNAVYATYCEEARIDYIEHVIGEAGASIGGDGGTADGADESGDPTDDGESGDTMGVVVANLQLDFEQPLPRTDAIEVAVWIPRLGEKSFPFEYEIRSPAGDRAAGESTVHATGETTMVAYDRATREAVRIPDRWRDPVVEFEGL